MKTGTLLCCLFVIAPLFAATGLPGDYQGLAFGADTLALKKAFPVSENQRFSVARLDRASLGERTVYRVIFRKGLVDSAWLYFASNRFAMAVEYYYPGEDQFRKAVSRVTGRYGQFVGSGLTFWKRQDNLMCLIAYREGLSRATATWMDLKLSEGLRNATAEGDSIEAINHELRDLKRELDSLETPRTKKKK